jgi:hypothetical protein
VAHRPGPHGLHQAHQGLRRPPTAEGKTKTEIMRCLKRYIAREVFPHLLAEAANHDPGQARRMQSA